MKAIVVAMGFAGLMLSSFRVGQRHEMERKEKGILSYIRAHDTDELKKKNIRRMELQSQPEKLNSAFRN